MRKDCGIGITGKLEKSIETDFAGFSLVFQGQYYTETYELYGARHCFATSHPGEGMYLP